MDALDLLKAERDTARDFAKEAWGRLDAALRLVLTLGLVLLALAIGVWVHPLSKTLTAANSSLEKIYRELPDLRPESREAGGSKGSGSATGKLRVATLGKLANSDTRKRIGVLIEALESFKEVSIDSPWENAAHQVLDSCGDRNANEFCLDNSRPISSDEHPGELRFAIAAVRGCCSPAGSEYSSLEEISSLLDWGFNDGQGVDDLETRELWDLKETLKGRKLADVWSSVEDLDDHFDKFQEYLDDQTLAGLPGYSERDESIKKVLTSVEADIRRVKTDVLQVAPKYQGQPIPVDLGRVFETLPPLALLAALYIWSRLREARRASLLYFCLNSDLAERVKDAWREQSAPVLETLPLRLGTSRSILISAEVLLVAMILAVVTVIIDADWKDRWAIELVILSAIVVCLAASGARSSQSWQTLGYRRRSGSQSSGRGRSRSAGSIVLVSTLVASWAWSGGEPAVAQKVEIVLLSGGEEFVDSLRSYLVSDSFRDSPTPTVREALDLAGAAAQSSEAWANIWKDGGVASECLTRFSETSKCARAIQRFLKDKTLADRRFILVAIVRREEVQLDLEVLHLPPGRSGEGLVFQKPGLKPWMLEAGEPKQISDKRVSDAPGKRIFDRIASALAPNYAVVSGSRVPSEQWYLTESANEPDIFKVYSDADFWFARKNDVYRIWEHDPTSQRPVRRSRYCVILDKFVSGNRNIVEGRLYAPGQSVESETRFGTQRPVKLEFIRNGSWTMYENRSFISLKDWEPNDATQLKNLRLFKLFSEALPATFNPDLLEGKTRDDAYVVEFSLDKRDADEGEPWLEIREKYDGCTETRLKKYNISENRYAGPKYNPTGSLHERYERIFQHYLELLTLSGDSQKGFGSRDWITRKCLSQ